jgi:hypothetical protein
MPGIHTITSIYANFETPWNFPEGNSDGKDDDTVIRLWLKNDLGADLGALQALGAVMMERRKVRIKFLQLIPYRFPSPLGCR